jgi:hypothetical protein
MSEDMKLLNEQLIRILEHIGDLYRRVIALEDKEEQHGKVD